MIRLCASSPTTSAHQWSYKPQQYRSLLFFNLKQGALVNSKLDPELWRDGHLAIAFDSDLHRLLHSHTELWS
jgi:hypothetical protein